MVSLECLMDPYQIIHRFSHYNIYLDDRYIYHDWPSQVSHPSSLFPLEQPSEIISQSMAQHHHKTFVETCILAPMRKQMASSIADSDVSEDAMSSLEDVAKPVAGDIDQMYRTICEAEMKARFKIPLEVLKALEQALRPSTARINWTKTLAYILHAFLTDESMWKSWADMANRLSDDGWVNSADKYKVPVLLADRFNQFRDRYGIPHSNRVMLPAILWALHVGCEPIGLPPKSKRPSANKR